jgi:hypothetical protein
MSIAFVVFATRAKTIQRHGDHVRVVSEMNLNTATLATHLNELLVLFPRKLDTRIRDDVEWG